MTHRALHRSARVPAVALALALTLTLATEPSAGRAAEAADGQSLTEQHAHIAGEPGSNEVDLALRSKRQQVDGGPSAAGRDADALRYTFEKVSRPPGPQPAPDPCAQAGGQLVNVLRQPTHPPDPQVTSARPEGGPDAGPDAGPDGGSVITLRTACLTRELAALVDESPGIGAEQVAELLRRVTLPGGTIRAVPGDAGLAGLDAQFWVEGAAQGPVDLALGPAVLHAEFAVTGYRWSFGDGTTLTTATRTATGTATGPASAARQGRSGVVSHVYERGGAYTVTVEATWSAWGFLGDTPIAGVDGLASGTAISYRVDEAYGVLTR